MTPVPPNTANRYKVHYSGPFGDHTMVFHGVPAATQAAMRTAVSAIVTAMSGAQWNGTTWNLAEWAPLGSSIFTVDPAWTTITRTSATNPAADDAPSHFAQWGGRSPTTGRRVKYYLFEDTLGDNSDMRFTRAANADVDAVLDAIDAQAAVIATIDGTVYNPYQYANVGQNDHLTHRARNT